MKLWISSLYVGILFSWKPVPSTRPFLTSSNDTLPSTPQSAINSIFRMVYDGLVISSLFYIKSHGWYCFIQTINEGWRTVEVLMIWSIIQYNRGIWPLQFFVSYRSPIFSFKKMALCLHQMKIIYFWIKICSYFRCLHVYMCI